MCDDDIERAHRTGRAARDKHRPIIARFTNFKQKEKVLRAARQQKVAGFYISEDFSDSTRQERRKLLEFRKEIRNKGHKTFLRYRKLVVRNAEGKENWYEVKDKDVAKIKEGFHTDDDHATPSQ